MSRGTSLFFFEFKNLYLIYHLLKNSKYFEMLIRLHKKHMIGPKVKENLMTCVC